MRTTRRRLLATAAASAALAGCLGDDGGGTEPTTTATDTLTETTAAGTTESDGSGDPTVQVRSHPDYGDILVGSDDETLYMFDQDEQGADASACSGSCADSWPPLTVADEPAAGDDVAAELSTFDRADGSTQVAANGWPLYYYASDAEPGDAAGQAVGDVWWVLAPDGVPIKPDDGADETPTAGDETPTQTTDGDGYYRVGRPA